MELHQKQQLIAFLSGYVTPRRLERMTKVLEQRTRHLCVVMEDIYQSHNASAVLRSCECFGIQDVHIIENRNTYQVNPDVALGASRWLSLYRYNESDNNTVKCISQLKEKGYRIVATSPHQDDCLLEELPVTEKTALLFGTELKGLSREALDMADGYVKIPMQGFTESFNISVCAAICLYYLSPKVRNTTGNWKLSDEERADIMIEWLQHSVSNPKGLTQHFKQQLGF